MLQPNVAMPQRAGADMPNNHSSVPKTLADLSEAACYDLLHSVINDFTQWKTARQPLEKKWQECWEAYLCEPPLSYTQNDSDYNDRSRVVRPVLYESVEAIQANLMNAMFPSDERFFSVSGQTEVDHQYADIIEAYLRNKLETLHFSEKYALFLKQAIITGNSVAAVPWIHKTRTRKTYQPVTVLGVTIGTEKHTVTDTLFSGPDFQVLDMFDVVMDPNQPDFQQTKVIRRLSRSLCELKNNPHYTNLEGLLEKISATDDAGKNAKRQSFGIQTGLLKDTSSAQNHVTLLEAWGDFVLAGVHYENYVCVVANQSQVIRFEPNPYDHGQKPFVFTNFIPVPNEIYGIGAIEKSLGLHHAINTLTNQKLDVINLSINNPFTYLINDDVFDPDSFVTRPGALIPVKSHDTLKPIEYLNNFTVAFNEIADLKNEVQEVTGALKYFTGAVDPGNRTATEVSALVSGGSQKFNSFISHLENTSLEPFIEMVFDSAKQFMTIPETLKIAQDNGELSFVEIIPALIQRGRYSFKVDGSQGAIQQGQELKSMVDFVHLVQQIPQLANRVNLTPIMRKIYRRLGFKDEDQIFVTQPVQQQDVS